MSTSIDIAIEVVLWLYAMVLLVLWLVCYLPLVALNHAQALFYALGTFDEAHGGWSFADRYEFALFDHGFPR